MEDECTSSADCLAGLFCGIPLAAGGQGGTLCLGPGQGLPVLFNGVECSGNSTDTEGDLRMYFEIPAGDVTEFYRLPFPNDIRLEDGHPDLSGHPTPGSEILGFDIVQQYVDAIQTNQEGFGLNQAVQIRFSGRVDFDILSADGDTATHYLVDITPDSPEYNGHQPVFWQAATSKGRYICYNWLTIRPAWGRPLERGTTYAAIVTDNTRGANGESLVQDDQFSMMLESNRPSGALGPAWDAYAPLRAWVDDQDLDPNSIMGAAVFTTGDPWQVSGRLREAVHAGAASSVTELTRCDTGVQSPCHDGLEGEEHKRGCFAADSGFHEVHGRLDLPIFQKGEAPYQESGGGLETEAGLPVEQRREDVCLSLGLPKSTQPDNGWPVIIYAHGTGGSFRGHLDTLGTLLSGPAEGDTTRFMLVGWDQIHHGDRRGESTADPETLVFNFMNPDAAQGNWQQSAAEIHALVRFVASLDISADDSPTGEAVKVDPTQIYFLGHSQGGTSGPIALPFEPDVRGAVLSGAGGGLILSLLGKTSPVDIPAGVSVALQEPGIGENHPVLNLLQAYFAPVDPLNYAQYVGARLVEDVTTPRHVLHLIGLRDTYTPNKALEAMATALRSTVVAPLHQDFHRRNVDAREPPVSGNVSPDGQTYTVVSRQYEPGTSGDGHFVLFREEEARDDVVEFLDTAVKEGVPVIGD